jgi:hypothetical protein
MAELYHKEVAVYFGSATLHGTVATRHARLSDHLGTADETFLLTNVQLRKEQASVSAAKVLMYKQRVILVADLSRGDERSSKETQFVRVDREAHTVIVGAGPFWLRGDIHLVKGGDLETVGLGTGRFIPLTQATFLEGPRIEPTTIIINREQIGCLFIDPKETA